MNKKKTLAVIVTLCAAIMVGGCGQKAEKPKQIIPVNTYKIALTDTNVSTEFSGTILARNSVPVRAKVTGNVVEKYIHGGDTVTEGQPLYRIDSRTYDSALAAARASAAQAGVIAENAQVDLARYQVLADNGAIATQVLDSQRTKAKQAEEAYHASQAQASIAQDNVNDTIVRAPFSGTLNMDDVDQGTFIAAGQTPLVTVQSVDPVLVSFSMNEQDYLALKKKANHDEALNHLQLRLSDGSIYEQEGRVVEVSKSVDAGSGKITVKAEFNNPDHVLLPGMFATVMTTGDVLKNAILVPTKAIIQILDKNFILVISDDNTVRQVPVQVGPTAGVFTVVRGDLKVNEQVLVDGITKVKVGMQVKPTVLTKQEVEAGK